MTEADRAQQPAVISENVACTANARRANGNFSGIAKAPENPRPAETFPELPECEFVARETFREMTLRRAALYVRHGARHFPATSNRTYSGGAR